MESGEKKTRHAGGRPKKAVRRDQQLAVMCTRLERKVVQMKAGVAGLSVSEYLRTLALKGKVDARAKALPKEVLLFTATLNHLAANLNQVARWPGGATAATHSPRLSGRNSRYCPAR
jgi:hypothetical protein